MWLFHSPNTLKEGSTVKFSASPQQRINEDSFVCATKLLFSSQLPFSWAAVASGTQRLSLPLTITNRPARCRRHGPGAEVLRKAGQGQVSCTRMTCCALSVKAQDRVALVARCLLPFPCLLQSKYTAATYCDLRAKKQECRSSSWEKQREQSKHRKDLRKWWWQG